MKREIADTIKWGFIDKLSSQVLYAVTGVVLARMLSHSDFGLVGAILVFQAFASLFVDSGFSSALIQRKNPTREDYSTVMWFNIGMAVLLYLILFFCAPLIAEWFQGDMRLVPLSRVMFLSFIITATTIVPVNRLMKKMDVRMVAASNSLGLIGGAIAGIYLAISGYGAWAIVWQSIVLATVKSAVLWATAHWTPALSFSWQRLKGFFNVGAGVMVSSFLNTLFLNIYSFFIGNRAGLGPLGLYTQADKWSKMGIMSLSQSLTQAYLPALSEIQDDPERFARATAKMNRTASYLLFPALGVLAAMATPLFHLLFGTKWDASIILFQILLLRGVFTILAAVYNNYILALGKSRLLVVAEIVRDGVALAAIIPTLPILGMSTSDDPTLGIRIFLYGQVAATAVGCLITLLIASRLTGRSWLRMMADSLPYLLLGGIVSTCVWLLPGIIPPLNPAALLVIQGLAALALYLGLNRLLGSKVQADALSVLLKRRQSLS